MSEGEESKPRRRRGRRRGRRARSAATPDTTATPAPSGPVANSPDSSTGRTPDGADGNPADQPPRPRRRPGPRLRTVRETSAGGLVVDGIGKPREEQLAALIGRVDRRGRMLWSLPKGHIEQGETAEQTAMREVAEETGIQGDVLAALGSIDYWFVTDGQRVHKTVHHYLMSFSGGELCDEDVEVTEVAWVPVAELPHRLAYADERRLARVAHELLELLHNDGPAALPPLPPSAPRRRPQSHSHTRNHHSPRQVPDAAAGRSDRRANGGGPES